MSETNIVAAEIETVAIKGRSLWEDASRRLMRNTAAMVSLVVIVILALLAIFGPTCGCTITTRFSATGLARRQRSTIGTSSAPIRWAAI